MIKSFGVKNYFCFKEGAEVNFSCEGLAAETIGEEISSIIGIKGANGSGKTNLIKAIGGFSRFSVHSAQSNFASIPVYGHFGSTEPTDFYIEFEEGGVEYTYEISLDRKKVLREFISRKKGRTVPVLERVGDELVQCIKAYKELRSIKLKENASLLSTYKGYKFNKEMPDLDVVHSTLRNIYSNTSFRGYEALDAPFSLSELSEFFKDFPSELEFVKQIIRAADDSIHDIEIHKGVNDEGGEEFYPVFMHFSHGKLTPIIYVFESSGTQILYKTLAHYISALNKGALLCIDEFDIHLHAMILPSLLNLFLDKKINNKGAQLLFTAHNTEIIDMLGKYRTILVNKEEGESYCYRLDEIPGSLIRKDRAIAPIYLQGKIGGVPKEHA